MGRLRRWATRISCASPALRFWVAAVLEGEVMLVVVFLDRWGRRCCRRVGGIGLMRECWRGTVEALVDSALATGADGREGVDE